MESEGRDTPRRTERRRAAHVGRGPSGGGRPPGKRDLRGSQRRALGLGLLCSGTAHVLLLTAGALPFRPPAAAPSGPWSFAALELPPEVSVPKPPEPLRRPDLPRVREIRLEEAVELPSRPDPPDAATVLPPPPNLGPTEGPSYIRDELVPLLPDRRRYEMAMRRYYPGRLVRAGIQGTVELLLLVDEEGAVERIELEESSGHGRLDDAARRIARHLRYAPAMMRDREVAVWVSQPFCFVVADPERRPPGPEACARRVGGAP